jgi:glycosyltransferase involved in cell wall biosynthesis
MPSSPAELEHSAVSLSVVVPAYREGPTIYKAIGVLLESLHALDRSYEVIVVSDGNDDETVEEAARHGEPVSVLHYEMRRGKGYALRFGISRARGDYIAFIDADMELHPDGLRPLLTLVDQGADAAIGSKRHPDSQVYYPLTRRVQSAVYQRLIGVLFDLAVTDTQTGIKVFRGQLLRDSVAHISSDGFAFDLELLVVLRQHGARIAEGPVQLDYRFATTTGIRAVVDVMRDTWRIYRRHRRVADQGS